MIQDTGFPCPSFLLEFLCLVFVNFYLGRQALRLPRVDWKALYCLERLRPVIGGAQQTLLFAALLQVAT